MAKKVIRMESNVELQDIPQQAPEAITAGDPQEKDHTYYTSEDESLSAGVWESTAGTLEVEYYPVDEFCYVISGSVVITNHEDNSREEIKAGEAFFIPKGTGLTWHVPEHIRKYYVIRGYAE